MMRLEADQGFADGWATAEEAVAVAIDFALAASDRSAEPARLYEADILRHAEVWALLARVLAVTGPVPVRKPSTSGG